MYIKYQLKKFYNYMKMANELGMNIIPGGYVSNGIYSWQQYVSYKKGHIVIKVSKSILTGYEYQINVENIDVYKDKWLHRVPKEMIKQINLMMKEIHDYIRLCNKNKLSRSHKRFIKSKELEEKTHKIKEHQKEKNRLIEIFK